jgi:hypothetical protein
MNKTPVLLATIMWPVLAASLLAPACSSGESAPSTSGGSGGSGGTTSIGTGTGGFTPIQSSGGRSGTGTSTGGNFVSVGTGGASTSGATGGSIIIGGGSGGSVIVGGGSGGGAVVGGMDNASAMNGYVMNTLWKGYAFTSTSGTSAMIAPVCDPAGIVPCFTGKQLCASGTVGADVTGSSTAQLGFNINQAATGGVAGAIATTGTGLSLALSGNVTGLRAQIQTADMKTRWCANLTGPTTTIPWAMFNTACYMPSAGTYYVPGTPIAQVGVVVPSAATPTPFSFCIVDAHQY